LEPAGPTATQGKARPPAGSPPAAPRRFVYAGGDCPLAGYTIKRGIGHGGFGEIYFATSDAGKEVALKLIRRNLDVELRGTSQCLNLKHPNLLAVYDIRNDAQGDTWVVMEYAAQRSLEEVLAQRPGGLGPEEAMDWFRGIGAAVAYLHDHGIVHRDLKPGNIFRDEGIVKVGDYGLAKFISQTRRTGHTESVGTVHYMAPEVAKGRYGKELDIYALGVMLYELLAGRLPFEGESVAEVLMKHLTAKPDLSPLTEPYRSVVGRALEKDPDDRFRSVEEMMAALGCSPHASSSYVNRREPTAPGGGGEEGDRSMFSHHGFLRMEGKQAEKRTSPQPPRERSAGGGVEQRVLRWLWQRRLPIVILMLLIGAILARTGEGVELLPVVARTLLAGAVVFLVACVVSYLGRRFFRWIAALQARPRPAAPVASREPPPADRGVRWDRRRLFERPVAAMIVKSPRERLTELVGSLLLSAWTAAAACCVVFLLAAYHGGGAAAPRPEQCAWLLAVSITGSWAVLIASKFWEGFCGDAWIRRLVSLMLGLAVGAVAFGLADALLVRLTPDAGLSVPLGYRAPPAFYADDGRPLLLAFMAAFGTLFFLVRFWRLADPMRRRRVRLWLIVWHVVLGVLVAALWDFPQPWLSMVAGAISASVQLSSPWVPRQRR
jgi:hypothetical protein